MTAVIVLRHSLNLNLMILSKRGFEAEQNEPADFFATAEVCDATGAQ